MTIDVIIVDDQALARAGLRMILEGQPDLRIVGEGSDGAAERPAETMRRG
jgi:DNA-binding NarL/FixJ family response regulator